MGIFLAFLLFLFALIGHEIGHALILRECGIRIKRMGLGIPVGPRLTFTPAWAGKFFGDGCTIVISPLLLGAFVEPVEEDAKKPLPLLSEIAYLGGGVLANFVMLFILSAVLVLMTHGLTDDVVVNYYFGLKFSAVAWEIALGFMISGILLWSMRKFISVILPLIGIGMLVLLFSVVTTIPADKLAESNGSIVLIGEWALKVADVRGAIGFGMLINLALALTNLLPFCPLDGGLIVSRTLARISSVAARVFYRISFVPFAVLIIWALSADLLRFIGYFR